MWGGAPIFMLGPMSTLIAEPMVQPATPSGAVPIVQVSGLVKSYGHARVVDGVDFEVGSGEIFGLLGANGAGKTTTVECLQGLRRLDAGRLRVLGLAPIAEQSRLRNRIGSQLQDSALPDRLRVGEAVELFDRAPQSDPPPTWSSGGSPADSRRASPISRVVNANDCSSCWPC